MKHNGPQAASQLMELFRVLTGYRLLCNHLAALGAEVNA